MTGIGRWIKSAVNSSDGGKIVVYTPLDFTKNTQKLVKGIEFVYLPEKDIMTELDEVKNAPYSTEMHILKVHMVKRVIKKSRFQCLQLYQIASYKEPLHNHNPQRRWI